MKKTVWMLIVLVFAVSACKTKRFMVKEEAVTVVNASKDDVAYKYYVILGSFEKLENAMNFSDQLETKGFVSPVILKSEFGFYRVSVFASDIEKDARNKIASVLDMYTEYGDTWLLVKKQE